MYKNFFISIIIVLVLVISVKFSNSQEVGPKIFGLQLGMSKIEAEDTIKNLCSRFNGNIESGSQNDITYLWCKLDTDDSQQFGINIKNGVLYNYSLCGKLFGVDGEGDDNFVKLFSDKYNINGFEHISRNSFGYVYKNNDKGFQIKILPTCTRTPYFYLTVVVNSIQRNSDINFE